MATTILLIVGMILDIGIGAAAHKAVHKLSDRMEKLEKKVEVSHG